MAQVPRSSYWNRVKIEFSPKYLPPQKKTEEDSHTTHTGKMLKKSAFHLKRACICPPPPPHLGVWVLAMLGCWMWIMWHILKNPPRVDTHPVWSCVWSYQLSAINKEPPGDQGTTHRVPPKLSDSTIGVPHLQAQYLLSIILGHWLFQVSGMARGSRGSCSIEPRQTDFFE